MLQEISVAQGQTTVGKREHSPPGAGIHGFVVDWFLRLYMYHLHCTSRVRAVLELGCFTVTDLKSPSEKGTDSQL